MFDVDRYDTADFRGYPNSLTVLARSCKQSRNMLSPKLFRVPLSPVISQYKFLHYVQGQEPEPKVREYFYYIDHQGMVSKML